jgi:hypothetical protein
MSIAASLAEGIVAATDSENSCRQFAQQPLPRADKMQARDPLMAELNAGANG